MSICGRVWRYHGSGGICRGYLVVLVGALNSACTNWINFKIYENCFESQIWSVTTKLQMCNSTSWYVDTRLPARGKQKTVVTPREIHAHATLDRSLDIIHKHLRIRLISSNPMHSTTWQEDFEIKTVPQFRRPTASLQTIKCWSRW